MAATLSEVFPQEIVDTLTSAEFKQWAITKEHFSEELIDSMLTRCLQDPITCNSIRPTFREWQTGTVREKLRRNVQLLAVKFQATK